MQCRGKGVHVHKCFLLVSAVVFASLMTGFFHKGSVEKLATVKPAYGGEINFLFLKPDNPKAAVVLFPGGRGYLRLDIDGEIRRQRKSFLVVIREGFVDKGLMVAVFNPPEGMEDLRRTYRMSEQHGQDIKAVIEYLKKKRICRFGSSVTVAGRSRPPMAPLG